MFKEEKLCEFVKSFKRGELTIYVPNISIFSLEVFRVLTNGWVKDIQLADGSKSFPSDIKDVLFLNKLEEIDIAYLKSQNVRYLYNSIDDQDFYTNDNNYIYTIMQCLQIPKRSVFKALNNNCGVGNIFFTMEILFKLTLEKDKFTNLAIEYLHTDDNTVFMEGIKELEYTDPLIRPCIEKGIHVIRSIFNSINISHYKANQHIHCVSEVNGNVLNLNSYGGNVLAVLDVGFNIKGVEFINIEGRANGFIMRKEGIEGVTCEDVFKADSKNKEISYANDGILKYRNKIIPTTM